MGGDAFLQGARTSSKAVLVEGRPGGLTPPAASSAAVCERLSPRCKHSALKQHKRAQNGHKTHGIITRASPPVSAPPPALRPPAPMDRRASQRSVCRGPPTALQSARKQTIRTRRANRRVSDLPPGLCTHPAVSIPCHSRQRRSSGQLGHQAAADGTARHLPSRRADCPAAPRRAASRPVQGTSTSLHTKLCFGKRKRDDGGSTERLGSPSPLEAAAKLEPEHTYTSEYLGT